MTNKTLTSPIINVTSDATWDIYYRNASWLYTRLPVWTVWQVLTLAAWIPSWADSAWWGWWASFDWVRWQVIVTDWEVSDIEWTVWSLTAFDSWTFADIQISTKTRTSATFTVEAFKNDVSIWTATITSATAISWVRYYWTMTISSTYVDTDEIRFEVWDTGTWSTGLIISIK